MCFTFCKEMKYEDYMRSNKPLCISGVAIAVTSLFPISGVILEGWHSGVLWASFFAMQMAVFMPGIYLLHPRAFGLWIAISITVIIVGLLTFHHFWNSVPDWMDADIPAAVILAINVSIWLILGSSVVLGILGWINYLRGRKQTHNHTADGICKLVDDR
jgi:hypothetical protein